MKTKKSIWLLLLFGLQFSFAQERATITGFVSSEGKKIYKANVHLQNTNFETVTDSLGYFLIENVPVGSYGVQVSKVGFQSS